MNLKMKIQNKIINNNNPVFIIAELSANHNQDINIAIETIRAAKKIGVDAIKLQTYTADTITIDCDNKYFQINQGTIWDGTTLYELYKKAYTPWAWHEKLFQVAKEEGIICFSSPFDKTAVDFLEKFNVPAYKIASPEITDIPLIKYIAQKNKPIILSTGIAKKEDIDLAIKTCKDSGNNEIILLKCTSAYPTPMNEVNLLTMRDYKKKYEVIIGLSDHSLGIELPVAAVALGARVIEKHFILDKAIGGPDASFSLDFEEFSNMVKAIRNIEKALGKVTYELTEKTIKTREHCRSLFIVEDIKKGEKITKDNVKSIRPGYGLHPKYSEEILGKSVNQDLKRGTPLKLNYILI